MGDERIIIELDNETPIPFVEQILYQDEHLVVVDKPHFLPVIPAGQFCSKPYWCV
ncbi:MAG: hypothetical protein IPI79_15560 [Moraxellaceae bacterium]|nr:hypothetical protein [Moraxellaceae bacterium]